MGEALDRVLTYFPTARRSGTGYEALCPAHEDRKPSLSIGEGDDGRVLIRCHQGCDTRDVVAAVGLSMSDLFGEPLRAGLGMAQVKQAVPVVAEPASNGHKKGRIVASYPYHDSSDTMVYEVVRFDPKGFSQRHPDGHGGWIWNMNGIKRVLYRLPQLEAADTSRRVYLVEGEKDVERLMALGQVATTSPQGAKNWHLGHDAYREALRNRDVVILPDNDDDGRQYAIIVAESLVGIARACRTVALPDLPVKGDVSDWLDLGNTLEDLERIVSLSQPTQRFTVHWVDEVWESDDDIRWIVNGLLSEGSVNITYGAPGTKKTYALIDMAVCVATGQDWLTYPVESGPVLVIDEESGPKRLRRRFKQVLKGHNAFKGIPIAFLSLEAINVGKAADVVALTQLVDNIRPRLVILDALVDIMPGKDENNAGETQIILQALKIIAEHYQLAIVVIHHENKVGGYRGSTAIPGVVDLLLKITSEHSSSIVDFKSEKFRDGEPISFAAMVARDDLEDSVHFVTVTASETKQAKLSRSQQYVLRYLGENGGKAYFQDIKNNADTCAPRSVDRAVYELAEQKLIRRCNGGGNRTPAEYEIAPSETVK